MEDCENFGCEKLEAFAESDDDEEILEDPSQLNDVQEIETVYNKQVGRRREESFLGCFSQWLEGIYPPPPPLSGLTVKKALIVQ